MLEESKRPEAEPTAGIGKGVAAYIIGQEGAIARLKDFVGLYAEGSVPPGHILLTGPAGIGKETLARAFSFVYCKELTVIDAGENKKTSDLAPILGKLGEGDALLIRDIANVPRPLIGTLARALRNSTIELVVDRGMFSKTFNVPLKRFTCIGTAESQARCPADLVELFSLILPLQAYSQTELANICWHLVHQRGITITPDAAQLVATASSGTPHHIEVLVDRLLALGSTTVSDAQVSSVLGYGIGSIDASPTSGMEMLSGVNFEKVIAELLERMGFHAEMTEVTGDGGIDIVATLDQPMIGGRFLIQCKRFATDKLVGAATVRDFYGALSADRRAGKGILITTSGFSAQAVAFAEKLPIELIGGQKLQELLARYGISTKIKDAVRENEGGLFE